MAGWLKRHMDSFINGFGAAGLGKPSTSPGLADNKAQPH